MKAPSEEIYGKSTQGTECWKAGLYLVDYNAVADNKGSIFTWSLWFACWCVRRRWDRWQKQSRGWKLTRETRHSMTQLQGPSNTRSAAAPSSSTHEHPLTTLPPPTVGSLFSFARSSSRRLSLQMLKTSVMNAILCCFYLRGLYWILNLVIVTRMKDYWRSRVVACATEVLISPKQYSDSYPVILGNINGKWHVYYRKLRVTLGLEIKSCSKKFLNVLCDNSS